MKENESINLKDLSDNWKGTAPFRLLEKFDADFGAFLRRQPKLRRPIATHRAEKVIQKIEQHVRQYADVAYDLSDLIEEMREFAEDDAGFASDPTQEAYEILTDRHLRMHEKYLKLLQKADPLASDAGVFDPLEVELESIRVRYQEEWTQMIYHHDELNDTEYMICVDLYFGKAAAARKKIEGGMELLSKNFSAPHS